MDDNYVKVLFRFYSDVLDEETVETMWATIVDADNGLYKIDSIPFYGPLVSSNDVVFAQYDNEEGMLTYRSTIEHSGTSTIQVVLLDKTVDIETIRDKFKLLECTSEKLNKGYFAMEVPALINYKNIKSLLKELEVDKTIDFAEPCLSHKHESDLLA